ncbi:E3 ubiquitin-protein ligase PUB23-like [Asparagus officinalis]|uniref:E3 ubiquitin-protein ligase PUB23-like n=1 Tax=Asparagus officinalis TaxID=4686 RepID=UPI00098E58C5|nr:E3 ubiquitin-protein ligase PUB23-like [Asparagus officinalis]
MDSVEVPQFFICPISLQIMKDPVTAVTGITYERSSIERWLFVDNNTACPVTYRPAKRTRPLVARVDSSSASLRYGPLRAWIVTERSELSSNLLERLKVEFFEGVVRTIRDRISHAVTKCALHVLLNASPWGRNRTKMVESGAVNELIELELTGPDKRRTELCLGVLRTNLVRCDPPTGRRPTWVGTGGAGGGGRIGY